MASKRKDHISLTDEYISLGKSARIMHYLMIAGCTLALFSLIAPVVLLHSLHFNPTVKDRMSLEHSIGMMLGCPSGLLFSRWLIKCSLQQISYYNLKKMEIMLKSVALSLANSPTARNKILDSFLKTPEQQSALKKTGGMPEKNKDSQKKIPESVSKLMTKIIPGAEIYT